MTMTDRDGTILRPGDRVILIDEYFKDSPLWTGKLAVVGEREGGDYIVIENEEGATGGFFSYNLQLEDPRDDEVREKFGEDYL